MREIKFRAWQPFASLHRQPGMYLVDDMVWHKVTDDQPNAGEVFLTSERGTSRSSEFVEDVQIMQYTGLKDRNGVEIYEGDVVRAEHYQSWGEGGVFHNDTQLINVVEYTPGAYGIEDHFLMHFRSLEVIGNIYENPELLEAQS